MAVDVRDCHDLCESDEGESHRSVLVEEGEPILARARRENHTDQEAERATGGWNKEIPTLTG